MELESVTSPENFEVGVLTRSLIANLPHVSAPDTFEQSVLNNAKAPEPPTVTEIPTTSAPRPFWRAAMYSAVAAVAVVSSIMVLSSYQQEQQAVPQVQQQTMQPHEFDTARLMQVPVSAPQATISAGKVATPPKQAKKKVLRKAEIWPKAIAGEQTPENR